MENQKKQPHVSWFRRFFGLKDNDSRSDPTRGWFVLPPKSPMAPSGSQFMVSQPPPAEDEAKEDGK